MSCDNLDVTGLPSTGISISISICRVIDVTGLPKVCHGSVWCDATHSGGCDKEPRQTFFVLCFC